jgi:hypothetical protein
VFAAARGAGGALGGFYPLGNCPELILSPGAAADLFATGNGAGGAPDALAPAGEMPSVALTIEEFSAANLKHLLRARVATVAGGSVTSESVTAAHGALAFLANIGVTSIAAVRNAAGTVTYVPGVDYVTDVAGCAIETIAGGSIANGATLKVDYTFAAHERAAAFVDAPPYVALRIAGINTADNRAFVLDCYKVRFPAAESVELIGDRVARARLRCRLFYDTDRADTPTDGRFLRWRWL